MKTKENVIIFNYDNLSIEGRIDPKINTVWLK